MSSRTVTVLSPAGDIGFGFDADAVERAIAQGVDAIALQGTSTDAGPYYLGTGTSYIPRSGVVEDLKRLIPIAVEAKTPLLVSSGGAGTDSELDSILSELRDWAAQAGIPFRLATIHTSVPSDYLAQLIDSGREITPVPDGERYLGSRLTKGQVSEAVNIVAQIGPEPFMEALDTGADVVIAGRALDVAMYAAVPLMRDIPPEHAYMMAKALECGGLVAEPGSLLTGAIGVASPDSFTIAPTDPSARCTPRSVMAHIMYEEVDGQLLCYPGERIDYSSAHLHPLDERTVRVTNIGRQQDPQRRVKIEGARQVGYRAIVIAGIADPDVASALPASLDGLSSALSRRFGANHSIDVRPYGRSNTGATDICLVVDVVARESDMAVEIANFTKGYLMHFGFPGRKTTSGNLAMAFSPNAISVGPVFEFNIFHLAASHDPAEFSSVNYEEYGTI